MKLALPQLYFKLCSSYLQQEERDAMANAILTCSNEEFLEIFECEEKGRGIRTLRNFQKNEFVVEYKGEVVVNILCIVVQTLNLLYLMRVFIDDEVMEFFMYSTIAMYCGLILLTIWKNESTKQLTIGGAKKCHLSCGFR